MVAKTGAKNLMGMFLGVLGLRTLKWRRLVCKKELGCKVGWCMRVVVIA
jgi:hypothetical protein